MMNHPILPGMVDAYVREHQRELEQKAQLNELVRQAAEAGATSRVAFVAAPIRGLITLAAGIVGLVRRPDRSGHALPELEAEA
jgi:hypothetical protein